MMSLNILRAMANLHSLLDAVAHRRVLIIGDLMLDEYVWGTAERISPEAPVPVVRCQRRTYAPGGAANVAANVAALAGIPLVCGVIGDDDAGATLMTQLQQVGADISGVMRDPSRCTTLKTRVIAQHQQVVRIDHETDAAVSPAMHEKMTAYLASRITEADALIFSDYGKGLLADHCLPGWIALARERGKTVSAGPKPDSLRDYRNATLLSFNRGEAHQSVKNLRITDASAENPTDKIESIGRYLIQELQCHFLTITRGEEGVSLFTADGRHVRVPSVPVEVFDVAGAGDTFLAVATLGLCAGGGAEEAVTLANVAAACVVRKVGVATPHPEEIRRMLAMLEQ